MSTFVWTSAALLLAALELLTRGAIVRRLWGETCRLFAELDLACVRLLQRFIRPKFVIRGACTKRGCCCQHIVGDPPRLVKKSFLLAWYAHYHRVMHNFHVTARGPNDELIFSCHHLRTDGRCGIYRTRPRLCRNYPVLPFFGTPKVLPGCGYVVVPVAVDRMRPRARLPIVGAQVAVHHPTPDRPPEELDRAEDFHLVELP